MCVCWLVREWVGGWVGVFVGQWVREGGGGWVSGCLVKWLSDWAFIHCRSLIICPRKFWTLEMFITYVNGIRMQDTIGYNFAVLMFRSVADSACSYYSLTTFLVYTFSLFYSLGSAFPFADVLECRGFRLVKCCTQHLSLFYILGDRFFHLSMFWGVDVSISW